MKKRLAWRIQELAEGGLPESALAKISDFGDGLPQRWRMREAAKAAHAAQPAGTQAPASQQSHPRDARLPPPGTVLRRVHQGVEHEVTVGLDSFEYACERFKTLSAVAKRIAGTGWSCYLYFGLTKKAAPAPSASSSRPAQREEQP